MQTTAYQSLFHTHDQSLQLILRQLTQHLRQSFLQLSSYSIVLQGNDLLGLGRHVSYPGTDSSALPSAQPN